MLRFSDLARIKLADIHVFRDRVSILIRRRKNKQDRLSIIDIPALDHENDVRAMARLLRRLPNQRGYLIKSIYKGRGPSHLTTSYFLKERKTTANAETFKRWLLRAFRAVGVSEEDLTDVRNHIACG